MNPAEIYRWVLAGSDEELAVAALNDTALCDVSGYLAQDFDENEATGRVLGICMVEQTRRFTRRVRGGKTL